MDSSEEIIKKLRELFGSYRAEWLHDKIFNYFTEPWYFQSLIDNSPCVLQGGRGTGKTTILRGLSYQGQYKLCGNSIEKFDSKKYIGIYYKPNTNHVRAFRDDNIDFEKWKTVFTHYFNIIICKEIVQFLIWHIEKNVTDEVLSAQKMNSLANQLHIYAEIRTMNDLLKALENALYDFQSRINNLSDDSFGAIQFSLGEAPIIFLTAGVLELQQFQKKIFYFLIDEYENFEDYQQRILNTFIKHSSSLYTYKIGVREMGWRIKSTLNCNEHLNDPDDYILIDIAEHVTEFNRFDAFAKGICQQRIANLDESLNNFSIENGFPSLSMEEEAIMLGVEKTNEYQCLNSISDASKKVISGISPLYKYFIVLWASSHQTDLNEEIKDFALHPSRWSIRYENYKYATLFKIRKGRGKSGIQKYYSGWNTYLKLANGNIRYLMKLVYRAYEQHLLNGGEIGQPIDAKIQTKAAQDIGEKTLMELEAAWAHGAKLAQLVLTLGRLFNVLLSDAARVAPEINQFSIDGKMNEQCQSIISSAVMHLALVRLGGSKLADDGTTKAPLYAVHPIFAPYLMFSYRRKRKMSILAENVQKAVDEPKVFIHDYVKKESSSKKRGQLLLFPEDQYYEDDV